MEAIPATNSDLDLNPIIRTAISTTRTWTDNEQDFVVNCDLSNRGEERRVRGDGQQEPRPRGVRSDLRSRLHQGWGERPYNWGLGISVQQEVVPRVSVNVGYFRNWWGNWYTVDNRADAAGRLHAVQHHGAGRSAAAERRRLRGRRPV